MVLLKKTNNRGIFGVMLVFATIVIIVTAIISFNAARNKISSEIDTPIRITELNSIKDNFLAYSNDSTIVASQQSYADLIKEINTVFSGSCISYLSSVIIQDSCLVDSDKLENKFLENFNAEYSKKINDYPVIAIETNTNQINYYKISPKFETKLQKDLLILESTGQGINVSRHTNFMDYTYELSINPSMNLNLTKEKILLPKLRDLIQEINTKAKICRTKNNDQEIISCFNEIQSKEFALSPSIMTDYVLIEIKTKDKFFFEDSDIEKFDNLSFNVVISKT